MSVHVTVGDCRSELAKMPANSVQCVVTSPPYYGLRDYGVAGQIGIEATPNEYVSTLVEVFRDVRRVLKEDGTLWLNLGDSYARGFGGGSPGAKSSTNIGSYAGRKAGRKAPGLSGKDLIGIPWKVAFALQSDGWVLRQDIVWNKPNAMPESVQDRCTKSHEYIFLFTKADKYLFNNSAIKEQSEDGVRNKRSVWTVNTRPFKGAHFATFPPELVEPCILAGSDRGHTILDPFGGAGTTGLVAQANGRRAVLIELNPDYASIASTRVEVTADLFAAVSMKEERHSPPGRSAPSNGALHGSAWLPKEQGSET